MRFTCDRCGKKYVLSEDKVNAKTDVRLTCRQCGQVIIVKENDQVLVQETAARVGVPEGGLPPPPKPPPTRPPNASSAPGSMPPPATPSSPQATAAGTGTPSQPRPSNRPPPPVRKKSSAPPPGQPVSIAPGSVGSSAAGFPQPGQAAPQRVLQTEASAHTGASAPQMTHSSLPPGQPLTERTSAAASAALDRISRSIPSRLLAGATSQTEKRRLLAVFAVGLALGLLVGFLY